MLLSELCMITGWSLHIWQLLNLLMVTLVSDHYQCLGSVVIVFLIFLMQQFL